jgi:hypothetical protein
MIVRRRELKCRKKFAIIYLSRSLSGVGDDIANFIATIKLLLCHSLVRSVILFSIVQVSLLNARFSLMQKSGASFLSNDMQEHH